MMLQFLKSRLQNFGLRPWLAGVSLLLAGCTESYDLTLTWTSEAMPPEFVTIDNTEGGVRLSRGPAGSKLSGTIHIQAAGFKRRVDAEAAANALGIAEQLEGDELVIASVIPPEHRGKAFTIIYDLSVPEGSTVSVNTDKGPVSIDGLPVGSVETSFGGVTLVRTSAPPEDDTRISTNDGGIRVDVHEGGLDASTSNADINLFSILGNARATSTRGVIEARLSPPPGGEVFLATTDALIDLALSPTFGARLIASTTAPGSVIIDGLDFRPDGSSPGLAQGVLGDGRGRVDVRTTADDIVIGR